MRVNVTRESPISETSRVLQLEGMFDVPHQQRARMSWTGDFDFEERDWQIGAFIGPSGSGKSTLLGEMFGSPLEFDWTAGSVVDDFPEQYDMIAISETCGAVGFNTIPAWMRPYSVLSNGERFRVDLARRLLEAPDPIVIDEFTSVVDRQVAKIGAAAVAKHVRNTGKKLVVASCHFDIVDWLEPDWIIDPALMKLKWRRLRGRPTVDVTVSRVPYAAWHLFAPFHYLTGDLNPSAVCFVAFVAGQPASFLAILHHPHASVKNLKRASRAVTLPDWQGLGIAQVLRHAVAGAYKAQGWRFRTYPAHPAWVRAHDRSPEWALVKRPGEFGPKAGASSAMRHPKANKGRSDAAKRKKAWIAGNRPNAVFEYVGPASSAEDAALLLDCRG